MPQPEPFGIEFLFKSELIWWFFSENGSPSATLPQGIEDGVQPLNFHVVNHLKECSKSSFGKASLGCKPSEILYWKVINRDSVWRVVNGAVLAKGHASAPDLLEIVLYLRA